MNAKVKSRPPEAPSLDLERIRADFPSLANMAHGHRLAYLDNAATTMKPWAVINAMREFDSKEYATVRRGAYQLAEKATLRYEEARKTIARFINAASPDEVIFTSGATMGINLVAGSWGRKNLFAGDEIIVSQIEHHANIVPWQMVAEEKGAIIKVVPVDDDGEILMDAYEGLLSERTKLVAITHVANSTGTITPLKDIAAKARAAGAVVLADGAQAAPHMKVDVQDLGVDFYVFSAHKMYGPTGVGAVYGRKELLNEMPPFLTGGDMIEQVTFEKSTFAEPPHRFEAGTPPISQAIGFAAAADYLDSLGLEELEAYERELLGYATGLLGRMGEVRIIGAARHKAALISFTVQGAHPHDMATILDSEGIAVRAGHHCAQPAMERFCVPATTRASFSFYNTFDEVDRLAKAIRSAIELFGG